MANNDEQLGGLYGYYNRVVALFISFGFSRDEARDLTQDVFVRVIENMSTYRGEARWNFLEKIARNVALNAIRDRNAQKRNASLTVPADDTLAELPDHKASPEKQAEINERLARVSAALMKLSPSQRDCFIAFASGLRYAEISQSLGIPVAMVKSRLHEARIKLGIELDE